MASTDTTQPQGERLKKAIKWISAAQIEQPDKERMLLLRDAQIRFDLTPKESLFLEKNFTDINHGSETESGIAKK
jgi:hypothetical protein